MASGSGRERRRARLDALASWHDRQVVCVFKPYIGPDDEIIWEPTSRPLKMGDPPVSLRQQRISIVAPAICPEILACRSLPLASRRAATLQTRNEYPRSGPCHPRRVRYADVMVVCDSNPISFVTRDLRCILPMKRFAATFLLLILVSFPVSAADYQARVSASPMATRLPSCAMGDGSNCGLRASTHRRPANPSAAGPSRQHRSWHSPRRSRSGPAIPTAMGGRSPNSPCRTAVRSTAKMGREGMSWWYRQYAPNDRGWRGSKRTTRWPSGVYRPAESRMPWSWRRGDGVPQETGICGKLEESRLSFPDRMAGRYSCTPPSRWLATNVGPVLHEGCAHDC